MTEETKIETATNQADALGMLVDQLRTLRKEAVDGYRRFLNALVEAETAYADVWSPCGSFDTFLRDYHFCDPAVFSRYKLARALVDDDVIALIGPEAAMELPKASAGALPKVLDSIRAYVSESGAQPSQRYASHLLRSIEPVVVTPRALRAQQDRKALEAELTRLRKENMALRAEVERLRAAAQPPTNTGVPMEVGADAQPIAKAS